MRTTVSVKGLKELDRALAELPKATARNVLNRALLKAGEPMLEAAREFAPVKTGVLKSKIRMTTVKPKGHASKATFAAVMKAGGTRAQAGAAQRAFNRENGSTFAEVFIGVEDGVRQAWPQEVGTVNHGPNPYIRPAFEQNKDRALEIVVAEIRPQIEKAAARAARKALRKKG